MSSHILLLNGPNLGELGRREPSIYGSQSLLDVESVCRDAARQYQLGIRAQQSNHEGQLIDWIHQDDPERVGVVINPGGLAHTSIILRDALASLAVPIIEVHISNVHAREEFRHHSFLAPVVTGVITGLGTYGYALAIQYIGQKLSQQAVHA